MSLTEALEAAKPYMKTEDEDIVNHLFLKRWTRHLPEWAFSRVVDLELAGLRKDILQHYRESQ